MFTRVHDVEQMFGALNHFHHGRVRSGSASAPSRRGRGQATQQPLTNIYDEGDVLLFEAEIAGVAKGDLTIELQGKNLEIKGEPKNITPDGYTIHRHDRSLAGFSRSYVLPVEVDVERVTSSLENGILTLNLPKAEKAKKREIKIQ